MTVIASFSEEFPTTVIASVSEAIPGAKQIASHPLAMTGD
jgi:hypothetical protein